MSGETSQGETGSETGVSREAFVRRFGGAYEHSPWVAERAWRSGAAGGLGSAVALHAVMKSVVDEAGVDEKLALLRAHPDLVGRLSAPSEALTPSSLSEQAGAALDRCTPEEAQAFRTFNEAYRAKFGFPFILAIKGLDRARILATFRRRLDGTRAEEFETALAEVHKIALLRLRDLA